MNKWFYINITVLLFAIFTLTTSYHGIHMLIGVLGLCLMLYNWTRHAVFSTIRSSSNRETKIKFAQFSKKVLPLHKWTGTSAFLLILIHACLVVNRFGFLPGYPKMIGGMIAFVVLLLMVASGWFRWYRTTVIRRYFHWTTGFILFFIVVIHLLL